MSKTAPQLLIIGYVWPEPSSSAAGSRMMQLISVFRDAGWQVTFASSSADSEHAADLEELGIEQVQVKINDSSFDDFVKQLEPDIVMFDRFVVEEQFGWRVAEHCSEALRILDTEDLHCLRRVRRRAVSKGESFSTKDLLASEVAKREIASILRCDLSLIISKYEMALLKELFQVDERLLHYLPYLLDPIKDSEISRWPSFEDRAHYVTIGNFRHPPNWDSVQYLRQQVWPRIRRELPEAELHIYGAYPSQKVWDIHKPDDGFHIKGRAEDAKSVVRQARVCLAPLRFGAGLKGKLVEAMQCGTTSVTTKIGAEGINGKLDWPGKIADDPEGIAAAAGELYNNQSAWEEAQKQGIAIINRRFSKEMFAKDLVQRISDLRQNLEDHRLQNFTGAMLQHHTTASTRYMAKWIEEKNS